jgi:hypothetical protein
VLAAGLAPRRIFWTYAFVSAYPCDCRTAGAGVVGAQRVVVVAERVELLFEVAGAADEVLPRVARVDAEPARGVGHELGVADRPGRADRSRVAGGFGADEPDEDVRVDAFSSGCSPGECLPVGHD